MSDQKQSKQSSSKPGERPPPQPPDPDPRLITYIERGQKGGKEKR